jgi:hypothetical protein
VWNKYRLEHSDWKPDLSGVDLSDYDLVPEGRPFDLSKAILFGTKLPDTKERMVKEYLNVNLHGAVFDINTTYPADFDVAAHGAVFISQAQKSAFKPDIIKVFISYAWADDGPVCAIDQWLRDKRIDTKLDKRDFFAGSRIRDEIVRVMAQCNVILIFRSQRSKDKPWPQFETELAADLEMEAKKQRTDPPRIVYVVIDDTPLPTVSEKNRIAIMAKGKRFELVCEEIYHSILQLPRSAENVDLQKWLDYIF